MTYQGPQGHPVFPGHNSHVPNMAYASDVDMLGGMVLIDVEIPELTGILVSDEPICPFDYGAAVIGTGDVHGFDYLGQPISETVAGGGTTQAFYKVTSAPGGAAWADQYGLPYVFVGESNPAMTGVQWAAPADDEDHRGTFFFDAQPTDGEMVTLMYLTDQTNLHGDPYTTDMALGEAYSTPYAVTATVDATGLCTVVMPAALADEPTGVTVQFPDGMVAHGDLGGANVTHTLSPLWMEQYGQVIADNDPLLDKMIGITFASPYGKSGYADVTGSVAVLSAPAPSPAPAPPPAAITAPPASFTTHAQADDWLDNFATETGQAPLDWEGSTSLAEKHASAQTLYDEFTD